MKTVLLKPRFKGLPLHSLYDELIINPPKDYRVTKYNSLQSHPLIKTSSKHRNHYYKQLVYHLGSLPYMVAQSRESIKYENIDLIFASQHVIDNQVPWVVDLEYSDALGGYCNLMLTKEIILKKLKSKNCKFILPWSYWAQKTLFNSLDCKEIKEKIRIIRYTANPKKNNVSNKDKSKTRFLFLGSINPANVNSFEFKGLYETVNAFVDVQRKYDNLELVIRSLVSPEIRALVKKYPNIKIIENRLTPLELENLYQSSDVFPHSGFETMNSSILEAMSYGLPVIATSLYNTPEVIQHMKNGILIDLPKPNLFYTKSGTPNDYSKSFLDSMRALRPYMVEKLKESMKMLIEDSTLRNKIGQEARRVTEDGEFSTKRKNELLKEIFDESTT